MANISELLGKTITNVKGLAVGEDHASFQCSDGSIYLMYHSQDCCENVQIEDINGDINDLIGSPILQAEESTSNDILDGKPKCPDSFTWTFYKLATIKGYVTIRWLGESNGYYSELVDCERTDHITF